MNLPELLIPHLIFCAGAIVVISLLCLVWFRKGLKKRLGRRRQGGGTDETSVLQTASIKYNKTAACLFFALVLFLCLFFYLVIFCYWVGDRLKAKPTVDWQKRIHTIDTAVILGFGYEKRGTKMSPDRANMALLNWTLQNSSANTLFVQEGVLAACDMVEPTCQKLGKRVFRIHRHDDELDVNTLDATYCALEKMGQNNDNQAILVAHDLQLERTAWDFEKVKQSRADWADFTFIVPDLPETETPVHSAQLRTRSRLVYTFFELGSRLRDHFLPVPTRCVAP